MSAHLLPAMLFVLVAIVVVGVIFVACARADKRARPGVEPPHTREWYNWTADDEQALEKWADEGGHR